MDNFADSLYFLEGFNISNEIPEKIYIMIVILKFLLFCNIFFFLKLKKR